MKNNFHTTKFLKDNNIQDSKKFEKELRITLRLDYDQKASDLYKLDLNKLIELFFELSKDDIIMGASDIEIIK